MPSLGEAALGVKLVAAAIKEVAPAAAKSLESEVNLLAIAGKKLAGKKLAQAAPELVNVTSDEKLALQLMKRKSVLKAADLTPDEIMGPERFRTHVASVSPNSWLGQTYQTAAKHVGQMQAMDGSKFGFAAILKDNYVISVNHVISHGTNPMPMQYGYPSREFSPLRSRTMRMSEIVLDDGKTFSTELVAYNPERDLALLKIHGDTQLPGLEVADTLAAGRPRAAAVGYPISREFEQSAISPGTYLPGTDPSMPNFTRFAMRTYGGNSGGAIVSEGKLAGLVSHGNVTEDVGVTYSPRLEDIHDLLNVAKARRNEAGVFKVLRNEETGQLNITKEPSYDWWTRSKIGSHDSGKNINPAVFQVPESAPLKFRKGPLV